MTDKFARSRNDKQDSNNAYTHRFRKILASSSKNLLGFLGSHLSFQLVSKLFRSLKIVIVNRRPESGRVKATRNEGSLESTQTLLWELEGKVALFFLRTLVVSTFASVETTEATIEC